jgi:hypothetical protein
VIVWPLDSPVKKLAKKRKSARKTRIPMDPTRMALAAADRLRTLFARTHKLDRLGSSTTMRELAQRAALLERALPPSYVATARLISSIDGPEKLLDAAEMARTRAEIAQKLTHADAKRYVPFASLESGALAAFDIQSPTEDGEFPVVQVLGHETPRSLARNFGEWLDDVSDAREEQLERAAVLPASLRRLLVDLGFKFEDPIVGRLETGDIAAVEELLGPERTREIRTSADRLFDSSGQASLTLNVDEFSLAVSLRTGIFVFEADEVFRWLRTFRDENFFGDGGRAPSHPDAVRDLRRAPREPPLVLRGVIEVRCLPARRHTFRAASGRSADDFHLLGRTSSTSDRAPSVILHVVRGQVLRAEAASEPLNDIYVTPSGTIWALSLSGTAVRYEHGVATSYALQRPTKGRPWWYGIGGEGNRVFVWGAGALLEWKKGVFVPFTPDAELAEDESVLSFMMEEGQISMLVSGDRVGAVARFDGKSWQPISESSVIDGMLADLDVWRGVAIVLGRSGDVWRTEEGVPRPVVWDKRQQAFLGEQGSPRPMHHVRGYDGGALLASDGGIVAVGTSEPLFYSAGIRGPSRLARVGTDRDAGIVALSGPNAWLWKNGAFEVLDVREW